MKKSYRYLLGDSRTEAARLRAQARLWDPTAHALFDRLRIRRGWKILEIGPGQGSLHLELRRRACGPVDAVERSAAFAARLRRLCARDGFGEGHFWETDLLDAPLPRDRYDLIFTRWVFLFLPDPLAHLKKLARALKPGGLIAIEDYHRESFGMIPRPDDFYDFVLADRAFFASQGGDASIGGRLPALYRKIGLDVVDTHLTTKAGSPGSAEWNWLSTYFLGVMDRYAEYPPFNKAAAKRLRKTWLAAARDPHTILIGPTVVDAVARKRKRNR